MTEKKLACNVPYDNISLEYYMQPNRRSVTIILGAYFPNMRIAGNPRRRQKKWKRISSGTLAVLLREVPALNLKKVMSFSRIVFSERILRGYNSPIYRVPQNHNYLHIGHGELQPMRGQRRREIARLSLCSYHLFTRHTSIKRGGVYGRPKKIRREPE